MSSRRQVRRPNGRNRRPNGQTANGNGNGASRNGAARTPLLPTGVNNKATAPPAIQQYTYSMEEVMDIITVAPTTVVGELVYNTLVTPQSCARLSIFAQAFQRVAWIKASVHLVALNGSIVKTGYTMGFVEDPEIQVPTDVKETIPFLTALRTTTVRQAWVESECGRVVVASDMPEMYTQRGSDVRRYSPGRIMVAFAGSPGDAATFQVMLRYHVRLYVPTAIRSSPAPGPNTRLTITGNGSAVPITPGRGLDAVPQFGTLPLQPETDYLLVSPWTINWSDEGPDTDPPLAPIAFCRGFRTPVAAQLANPSQYSLLIGPGWDTNYTAQRIGLVDSTEARVGRTFFPPGTEFLVP